MVVNYPPHLNSTKKEAKKEFIGIRDGLKIRDKLEVKIKRGEKSWNYFVISYAILLTLVIAIVSVLEIRWFHKVPLILIGMLFLFRLCFFNNWFRNKIVGIMSKSQEKIEKYED